MTVVRTEWMSTSEAANRLGLNLRDVYCLIRDGQLRAVSFGRVVRVSAADVERRRGDGENGGHAGVREPRRPRPSSGSGSAPPF